MRLIKDLQTRFQGRKEIVFDGGTPSWWFAMEEDEDGDEEDEDTKDKGDNDDSNRKRKREESIVIPPCESANEDDSSTTKRSRSDDNETFPKLPNEVLQPISNDSGKYNRAISVLTQMTTPPTSPSSDQKPMSALPLKSEVDISDSNTNSTDLLPFIKSNQEKYKVTWLSTKGRRGLLLILTEAVFFIEQSTPSISISIVTNMKFPSPKDLSKLQHRTLLEVVLVEDMKNKSTYRFYVQDILCIEGGMVYHKPLAQRLRYLNDGVLMPRKKDETLQQHSEQTNVYANEQIKIRAKEYFPMKKIGFVMKDVCSGVGHDAEGIRVVPVGEYGIGESCDDSKTTAVVWRKERDVDGEKFKSLLLATE